MKPIKTDVIIRTVVLFVALVNQFLVMFGKSPLPFGEAEIASIVLSVDVAISTIATAVAALWAWWYDNDITKEARSKK